MALGIAFTGTGSFTPFLPLAHGDALLSWVTWVEGQGAISWQGAWGGYSVTFSDRSNLFKASVDNYKFKAHYIKTS